MPPSSNVFRLALTVLVVAGSQVASEPLACGQGIMWSPYRDIDQSEEAKTRRVQQKQIRLPPPIRLAQYQSSELQMIPTASAEGADRVVTESIDPPEIPSQPAMQSMPSPRSMFAFPSGSPTHLVIRSPATQAKLSKRRPTVLHQGAMASHSETESGNHQAGNHQEGGPTELASHFLDSDRQRIPPPPIHGQHSKLTKKRLPLGPIQPRQATIPGAQERATWKQPYSYGYFGSKGTRHWGTHHGYRDRYTEYRYR